MDKKSKKNLEWLCRVLLLGIGLYILFKWYSSSEYNWIIFFGIVIISGTIPHIIIYSMIPDKKKSFTMKTKQKKPNQEQSIPHNRLLPEEKILTLPLEKISWREFERLCFLYYKAKGYKPRETSSGADGGIDLIIYNRHHMTEVAIQIKHYINSGNQIDVKLIRELDSAKKNHRCIMADFITTSTFTNPALVEADDRKIETRDINWVRSNIEPWRRLEAKKRNLVS